eukprot:293094-Pyramimonas_sp.AAC.1
MKKERVLVWRGSPCRARGRPRQSPGLNGGQHDWCGEEICMEQDADTKMAGVLEATEQTVPTVQKDVCCRGPCFAEANHIHHRWRNPPNCFASLHSV